MATITINGELILDQTAGIQDDDVDVSNTAGVLVGGLDSQFLAYLNTLSLTAVQRNFAAKVEGASQANMVTVATTPGETIGKLFFSDDTGNDFDGDLVPGVTTLGGAPLYFWSAQNGKVVLVTTSNVAATSGTVVAAFYIESNDATNTAAKVESITFASLLHPDINDPDDSVDFSDVLRVSAVVTTGIGDDVIVDDDGPTIVTSTDTVQLTVDETVFATNDTQNFATEFTSDFGEDGGGDITYALAIGAGSTGLVASISNQAVVLSVVAGQVVATAGVGGDIVFVVSVSTTGSVTLDQRLAVRHDPNTGPNQSTTLAADNLITLTATITDADGDQKSALLPIGRNLNFLDDAPSVVGSGTEPTITLDETTYGSNTGNFAPNFTPTFGNDGDGGTTYSLGVMAGVIVGLNDSNTGDAISLAKVGDVVEARTAGGLLVFTVSVSAAGVVTFDQDRSVKHADASDPDDSRGLGAADLITLTATVSDKDGDQASTTLNIADNLFIEDDGPTVTVPSSAATAGAAVHLGNAVGQIGGGTFGYNIGADDHSAAYYTNTPPNANSDFVGMTLTGSAGTPPPSVPNLINPTVTRFSETANTATFNWSFSYDADPITGGVQTGTAAGTLTFDKVDETFSIVVTDAVEGYSFNVLKTSETIVKAPAGNTGHPEIVVSELETNGFYVQFTANSNPNGNPFGFNATGDGAPIAGDTTFTAGQMVSSNFEDWVSATGNTNGVAGDTIQKGELLTLRFFGENIMSDVVPGAPGGGTERLTETDRVAGLVIKFDGIGNAEDLILILDLINPTSGATTTRSVFVQNADLIKGTVPSPYNTEFSLDNNDALVIVETNDYNLAGENYQIQGVQLMQSGNGLSGSAINLNGAVGTSGGSNANPTQAWDAVDQDVLKITDIGFVQTTSGFQDAALDFSFQVADADLDLIGVQHIHALISNAYTV